MLKNYLKTALRSIRRHPSSFIINMAGLSVGIACSILILLWVQDELSVDRHHDKTGRIYQVMENQAYASDNIFTTPATPGLLAPELKNEVPEIEYASTYTWNVEYLFTHEGRSYRESGIYARPDLFNILTLPLLHGEKGSLLVQPNSLVLSASLAQKYFGNRNPVGETITLNGDDVHTVTGVFRDLPASSTLQFDYLLRFEDFLETNSWATNWGSNGPRTLVALREDADASAVEEKIRDFIKERNEGSVVDLFLFPYGDQYLYGRFDNGESVGGRIAYVRLFSAVAFFVLLIACINFMNLSTARSSKRAKEVGIRKSIGASRSSLVGQYLGESILTSLAALLLSVLLVEATLPVFNELTGKAISINYLDPVPLLSFLGIALLTGLIAGSYPALYLSSFQAVKVLKGTVKSSFGERFARRGLVIFQFAMSVILIISTIIIYNQIQYVQTKNLGYQKENLITFSIEGALRSRWDAFRQEVSALPGVGGVSRTTHRFLGRNSSTSGLDWPGKQPETNVLFEMARVDYGLVETLGFDMASGRSFSREFGADTSRIIVNEAGVEVMGLEQPLGTSVGLWGEQWEIIGVLDDFNYQSLRNEVEPMFLIVDDSFAFTGFIRLEVENITGTVNQIEALYKEFNPDYPFDYNFMDRQYEALYRSETRVGKLAGYFGAFAVFISCLGLFGLSAFTTEQRNREIGVRKVLGASVRSLLVLLTADFTKLVLVSIAVAVPVAWWMMDVWLSDYAYRIGIGAAPFLYAGAGALLIAWLTVSYQSVRAALMNPVKSLRSE